MSVTAHPPQTSPLTEEDKRYYDGSTVTPAIRRHMQEWHT
jgi:hypothetical protein